MSASATQGGHNEHCQIIGTCCSAHKHRPMRAGFLCDSWVSVMFLCTAFSTRISSWCQRPYRSSSNRHWKILLWPPYVIGGHYIFALWLLSFFLA